MSSETAEAVATTTPSEECKACDILELACELVQDKEKCKEAVKKLRRPDITAEQVERILTEVLGKEQMELLRKTAAERLLKEKEEKVG
jgi:oligoribonuclease NrnB/cAMP/cGMP phosphodiesterase (DHH superfamily)